MPIEIGFLINREDGFTRRDVITWGDGGVTIVDKDGFVLYGNNGEVYEDKNPKSEHAIICRKVLAESNHTL